VSAAVCIDLEHQGLAGAIGAHLLVDPEPAVVDPGPATTVDRLVAALGQEGVGPRDLRHILLTHVHLDHAGGAGQLVERFPEATVWVHRDGAEHLADPDRLVASTRRTFGEDHDRLWGETLPVPRDRIQAWEPGRPGPWRTLRPLPTPGHIAHHVAYLDERDGTLLAGDAMGIVLAPGAPTHPPTPPPAVDLRAWEETLAELRVVAPERFGAAHFGLHADVPGRIDGLAEALASLEARVRRALQAGDEEDAARFEEEVRATLAEELPEERIARYFDTFSAATDWEGVRFYLERNPDAGSSR
jgi:glyoxylase-like metal-dependent hydrolase (beta-lactamase superfamily II)